MGQIMVESLFGILVEPLHIGIRLVLIKLCQSFTLTKEIIPKQFLYFPFWPCLKKKLN